MAKSPRNLLAYELPPSEVAPNLLLNRIQAQPIGADRWMQYVGNPAPGGFDPLVGFWNGNGVTQSQADALPFNPISGKLNPSGEFMANALMGASGGLKTLGKLASKLKTTYNPTDTSVPAFAEHPLGSRAIKEDYPHGIPAGGLVADIEGRPLSAQYVAGWQLDRGREVAGQSAAIPQTKEVSDAIATGLTGRSPVGVPPSAMGQDVGRLTVRDGKPILIEYDNSLAPSAVPNVVAHEISHAIDELAGKPSTASFMDELKAVYQPMSIGGTWNGNRQYTPVGYTKAEVPREYWAEAIRAYMQNPDYLKATAPNVAARIRKVVNNNPNLKHLIQFNSAAGLLVGASAGDDQ